MQESEAVQQVFLLAGERYIGCERAVAAAVAA